MVYDMGKEGLLQRKRKETDRRKVGLYLTDDGKALYDQAHADLIADIRARFSGMNGDRLDGMMQGFEMLCHSMEEHLASEQGG